MHNKMSMVFLRYDHSSSVNKLFDHSFHIKIGLIDEVIIYINYTEEDN